MGHRDEVETTASTAGGAVAEQDMGVDGTAVDVAALQQQLATAGAEAQANWDRYLRAAAELENVRRRGQQEVERVQKFALERFAGELLGVKDSLEMGLAAADSDASVETLREGTEATLKLLGNALEKFGVKEIDPRGAPFDPAVHEAISVQTSADATGEQVLTVVQKGYVLNGRLLRPARVIVVRRESAARP
jgi:molecular chaperone GrpE